MPGVEICKKPLVKQLYVQVASVTLASCPLQTGFSAFAKPKFVTHVRAIDPSDDNARCANVCRDAVAAQPERRPLQRWLLSKLQMATPKHHRSTLTWLCDHRTISEDSMQQMLGETHRLCKTESFAQKPALHPHKPAHAIIISSLSVF